MTYRLRYTTSDPRPFWMDRRARRDSGRDAWRGWLNWKITSEAVDAYTWATRKGVDGFLTKYPSLTKDFTIEEVPQ